MLPKEFVDLMVCDEQKDNNNNDDDSYSIYVTERVCGPYGT